MKITMQPTSKIVTLETPAGRVPARIWEGTTTRGLPVMVFVTRVAAHAAGDLAELIDELEETREPSPAAEAFPSRLAL